MLAALGCAFAPAACGGNTYYVDCGSGNDDADGLSPTKAWKSVRAVSGHEFGPGDLIQFKRGSVCSGMLWPKGSGSAMAPIRLDAWGTGPLPRIEATPGAEAALKLFDQEYWTIEHLEFIGGEPYGIFISGSKGILHGIHIADAVIHGVKGDPKNKETGLLVIASGTEQQHFDDVLIDGVTAYGTSEWAGIMIAGVRHGFPPETSRNTNVVIRNSIVHDVGGDGIVLFQVNHGVIENSVAWHTGMRDTQTIGTPNAIWTWMCRDCAVRHNEAFLTDSPGVDGGAFDIDYGNDDGVIEENYGHDTQGYCIAVFGAGWVTGNSAVRGNVCAANGLSPRLARLQGAVFLSTWNDGKIKTLRIFGNRIFWNPPIAAAAVVNIAAFDGSGQFENNAIQSSSPLMIRSDASLAFDRNSYRYSGQGSTKWEYAGNLYKDFQDYQRGSGQDAHSSEARLEAQPARKASAGARFPAFQFRDVEGTPVTFKANKWTLFGFVSASADDHDSRGQVTLLTSAWRQFHFAGLDAIVVPAHLRDTIRERNLVYDWNLGAIRILFDEGAAARALRVAIPGLALVNPAGQIVWRHDGLTTPAELGLTLRSSLGNPDYAQLDTEP